MKVKNLSLTIMLIIMLSVMVNASSDVIYGTMNSTTGNWTGNTTEVFLATYGSITCETNTTCSIVGEYDVPSYNYYKYFLSYTYNLSDINDARTLWNDGVESYAACYDGEGDTLMYFNISVVDVSETGTLWNNTISCLNRTDDTSWVIMIEWQNDTSEHTRQNLFWIDLPLEVAITLPESNITKTCGQWRSDSTFSVLFMYSDELSATANCSLYVNDVWQSSNESTSNYTETTLTGTLVDDCSTNIAKVRCTDVHDTVTSNYIYYFVDCCEACVSDISTSMIVFGVIALIVMGVLSSIFRNDAQKKFFKVLMFLTGAMLGLWFLMSVIAGSVC